MLDRAACERRVYRLATVLTGSPKAAVRVLEDVLGRRADLRTLDSAHLDRLTILRSREMKPAALDDPALDVRLARALADLPAQQREAWVLLHVYHLQPREAARAMDCSLTATKRHAALADATMRQAVGPAQDEAAKQVLTFTMHLDVPAIYRARYRRRGRVRWWGRAALIALLISTALALALWLSGALQ